MFKEYLTEARQAPLYHGTILDFAEEMVRNNHILAKTRHSIHPNQGSDPRNYENYPSVYGVSLSRSEKYAANYIIAEKSYDTCVVFELDQAVLTHTNRIVPMNYWASGSEAYKKTMAARPLATESEEFLIGNIKNLAKATLKVHIITIGTFKMLAETDKYPFIQAHPKLFYKGEFINA